MTRMLKSIGLTAVVIAVTAFAAAPAVAANKYIVSFRLTKWKAAHFDDAATAKGTLDTMKRIGCEARQGAHSGHIDVSYRSMRWRSISLKTDRESHQWAHWLQKNGFETVFVQPAQASHLETVAFRLPVAKSLHFNTSSKAESVADTLRMLGCEVKQNAHAGHYDVSVRCPRWRVIGLESHDSAHWWQDWLKANGFETKHSH